MLLRGKFSFGSISVHPSFNFVMSGSGGDTNGKRASVRVHVCMCACACVLVHVCACACVRVHVCACVCVISTLEEGNQEASICPQSSGMKATLVFYHDTNEV